jgi:hypothetical protein
MINIHHSKIPVEGVNVPPVLKPADMEPELGKTPGTLEHGHETGVGIAPPYKPYIAVHIQKANLTAPWAVRIGCISEAAVLRELESLELFEGHKPLISF